MYATSESKDCVAYLGLEVTMGQKVGFEVVDDGSTITFCVALEGQSRSARVRVRVGEAGGGGQRIAVMRLSEDHGDERKGWLRVVSDDRGATLRDGVSIDDATQVCGQWKLSTLNEKRGEEAWY